MSAALSGVTLKLIGVGHVFQIPVCHVNPFPVLNRRLEQLERNYDGIVALLATQRPPPSALGAEPTTSVSPSASTEMTARSTANAFHEAQLDIFDGGLVTEEYADGLVRNFIHMAPYFPFVALPREALLSDLRREAPMLLQAILVTSSWQNKSLQLALEREYLKILSTRLVVDGQKSLDMLQSLLVYVGWLVLIFMALTLKLTLTGISFRFHFHAKLEKQQISRLTALLVALAGDLGLARRPRKSEKQQMAIESHPPMGQGVPSSVAMSFLLRL